MKPGNRIIERDLRRFLDDEGYLGQSARFAFVELAATRRPGWEQLFSFSVRVVRAGDSEPQELCGLCLDDERTSRFEARLFDSQHEWQQQFEIWSEGMLRRPRPGVADDAATEKLLTGCFALVVIISIAALVATAL